MCGVEEKENEAQFIQAQMKRKRKEIWSPSLQIQIFESFYRSAAPELVAGGDEALIQKSKATKCLSPSTEI